MPRMRGIISCFSCIALQLACSGEDTTLIDNPGLQSTSAALRDMTASEASADLEQFFGYVRTFYGPYEYKEARFGYSIAELEEEARALIAADPTDDGFYAAINWFLSRFDDGHVNLIAAPRANPVISYDIGLFLTPVEGKALVAVIAPSLAGEGVAYGDEVLSVDGVSPFALLETEILKTEGFGNPLTNLHLINRALSRPGFAANLRPAEPTAHLELRRADGSTYTLDLIWRELRDQPVRFVSESAALGVDDYLSQRAVELNAGADGSLATIGSVTPFFLTPATAAVFDITPVIPNATMLARYGLDPTALPNIFAALYSHAGKTLLLVRQSRYGNAAELPYYRALFDQFDSFVDGLVVDQTHNPGGSIFYCQNFARLFADAAGESFVQAYNTDRGWVNDLRSDARTLDPTLTSEEARRFELLATRIEEAYDAGDSITHPYPLIGGNQLLPDEEYVWTKPRLVLIDELAGSCADIFPMLVKANGLAPLFGRRTMGLGGNVETFGPLANSQASVRLTRGLFTSHRADEAYPPSAFIENNGVHPDIEHIITASDFRSGFVGYMAHFSDVIVEQIGEEAP
jgi:hypothetical protein